MSHSDKAHAADDDDTEEQNLVDDDPFLSLTSTSKQSVSENNTNVLPFPALPRVILLTFGDSFHVLDDINPLKRQSLDSNSSCQKLVGYPDNASRRPRLQKAQIIPGLQLPHDKTLVRTRTRTGPSKTIPSKSILSHDQYPTLHILNITPHKTLPTIQRLKITCHDRKSTLPCLHRTAVCRQRACGMN
jgi:hypothetical protein